MPTPIDTLRAARGIRRAAAAALAGGLSVLALAPVFAFPVLFVTLPVLVLLIDGAAADTRAGTGRASRAWLGGRIGPMPVGTKGAGRGAPLQPDAPRRPSLRAAALIGWCFGFGYFLAGLYWIGEAFLVEREKFGWLMPFAVSLMPAGLALFHAAAVMLAGLLWRPGYARILALALAFGALEWLRGTVLTGFPWNALGYALTGTLPLMQWTALVGVNGLSFLAVLIFATPAVLADAPRQESKGAAVAEPFAPLWRHPGLFLPVLLIAVAMGLGALRLREPPPPDVAGVRLRLVQPNVSQAQKWTPENRDWIFQGFLDLSRLDARGVRDDLAGTTHLLWPESSVPFLLLDSPNALAAVGELLPDNVSLLTGALRLEETPAASGRTAKRRVYNSLIALDSQGRLAGTYDKLHLVPFGEYLPLQETLERLGLEQLTRIKGGFTAGHGPRRPMRVTGLPAFLPLICYEVIFPGELMQEGPRPAFLLNVTNDAWYGVTSGPYQHLHQTRVRAVEQGLPVVRVANTGISAIIDGRGHVRGSLALNRRGTIDSPLPAALAPTIYARYGDGLLAGLLLAGLLAYLVLLASARKSTYLRLQN